MDLWFGNRREPKLFHRSDNRNGTIACLLMDSRILFESINGKNVIKLKQIAYLFGCKFTHIEWLEHTEFLLFHEKYVLSPQTQMPRQHKQWMPTSKLCFDVIFSTSKIRTKIEFWLCFQMIEAYDTVRWLLLFLSLRQLNLWLFVLVCVYVCVFLTVQSSQHSLDVYMSLLIFYKYFE